MWQIEKSTRQLMIHLEKVNPIPWAVLIVAPGPHLLPSLALSLSPSRALSLALSLCLSVSISVCLCVCVFLSLSLARSLRLSRSVADMLEAVGVGYCCVGVGSALLLAVLLVTLPHASTKP